MWAIARYDLGLTSDEFYALTPRQFDALLKRKEHADTMQEFLFGQLAAMTANFSMAPPKKPARPQDFMPSQWGKAAKPKRRSKRTITRTLNRIFGVVHVADQSTDGRSQSRVEAKGSVGQAADDNR